MKLYYFTLPGILGWTPAQSTPWHLAGQGIQNHKTASVLYRNNQATVRRFDMGPPVRANPGTKKMMTETRAASLEGLPGWAWKMK